MYAAERATRPKSCAAAARTAAVTATATASGRGDHGATGAGLHPAAHGTTDDDRAASADGHHHGPAVTDGHDDIAASAHE